MVVQNILKLGSTIRVESPFGSHHYLVNLWHPSFASHSTKRSYRVKTKIVTCTLLSNRTSLGQTLADILKILILNIITMSSCWLYFDSKQV